jgi:hypothetical protein
MGGKASPPAPPDYSGVAAASEKSAELSYKYGQEQLAWAREQYASDREITDRVVDSAMRIADFNEVNARKDRRRYEDIYQPLEGDLATEARAFASPERRQQEVGKATASVAQQFDQQRVAAMQNLQDYGVDPTSGRGQGIDTMMRTAQGAATASAANQANAMVDATGRALRSEAINIGKGYPGQIAGQYGTALQGGNLAVNSQLAATASGANTMGTAPQWQGLGNQAVGTWGNTLNQSYQNQLGAYNAANQGSSGWGSAIGAGLGLATKLLPMIAEGGTVPATDGGDVPEQASPTRGVAIDDVPARLTAGEFVVPKDVAAWKGEEFFQKMIDNSRKAKGEATAKPTMAIGVAEEPTYVSRPRASALPMG